MPNFNAGETVICLVEIRNLGSALVDPATSMKISIVGSHGDEEVLDQNMVKDSTGKYHYDYQIPSTGLSGKYNVAYTATDGTRITILKESFNVE